MLNVILIARMIAALDVSVAVKQQVTECTLYGQVRQSSPVLFKRYLDCKEQMLNGNATRMRTGNEQGVRP